MNAHSIPSSLGLLDGSEPVVGVVYANRCCASLAACVHGFTGWRRTIGKDGTVSVIQVFFYGNGSLLLEGHVW